MSIRINGRFLADDIKISLQQEIATLQKNITFSIIYVGQDPVIDNFISYKQKFGDAIGVDVVVHSFDAEISQDELSGEIAKIELESDTMIVQLPLPVHLNTQTVLDMVPSHKDVDVLSSQAKSFFKTGAHDMYPPVAGAMMEVLTSQDFNMHGKNIVLVGYGNLVGKPFGDILTSMEITYNVIDKDTSDSEKTSLLLQADLIVAGAGVPGLITSGMVKTNVAFLDGGTTEAGKKVIGDIDPSCYESSLFYTPVPGGIGPLTIAVLYQNIVKSVKGFNTEK